MTEKEVYKNGVALLEEWEDVNYCEHSFKFKDEWLTDKEVVDKLNELTEENEQLEKENKELHIQFNLLREQRNEFHRGARENANRVGQLEKENKELQERNNRQCKQLDDLYRLIEEKDWRALSDILDDFKKADKQLQKEWSVKE